MSLKKVRFMSLILICFVLFFLISNLIFFHSNFEFLVIYILF
jgi:hypothetical protein